MKEKLKKVLKVFTVVSILGAGVGLIVKKKKDGSDTIGNFK